MNKKINIINFIKILYLITVVIYVFFSVIGMTSLDLNDAFLKISSIYNRLITIFLLLLSVVNIIISKITKRKVLFLLISFPLLILIFYYSGFALLIPYLFIIAYPNNLDSTKLGRYLYITLFVSVILVIILSIKGIIPNIVGIRGDGAIRNSYGFTTPNALGNIILYIFLMRVYSYKNWTKKSVLLWIFVFLAMYHIANSRMAFIVGVLILLLILLNTSHLISNKLLNLIYKIPIYLFVINSAISFFVINYFKTNQNNLYMLVNKLFSGRLYYMITFYNTYGITAFGNKTVQTISAAQVRESGNFLRWMGIDNSYLYISILFGITTLILFGIIYYFSEKSVEYNRNFGGALYLIAFIIIGLTESSISNVALNFLFFIFAEYLTKEKDKNDFKIEY